MTDKSAVPSETQQLLLSIGIPSCPAILLEVGAEMRRAEPDPNHIVHLVSSDVALSAALINAANSPLYGTTKCQSVDKAVLRLGLRRTQGLISAALLKRVLGKNGVSLDRFWDASAKRAMAMALLAQASGRIESDDGHAFGLFMDCGIAIMVQRFPNYHDTLKIANTTTRRSFTEIERDVHIIDHARVGSKLAQGWGLAEETAQAILLHHEYGILAAENIDAEHSERIRNFVALGLVADWIVQTYRGGNQTMEWAKGGALATKFLSAGDDTLAQWSNIAHTLFDEEER